MDERIYLLSRRDGVLVNRIFPIAEPHLYVGAHARPELLAALTTAQLALDSGGDLLGTRVLLMTPHSINS